MKQQPSGSQWPSTGERAEAPKIAIGPTVTAERSGLSRRALLLMTGVTFAGAALVDMLAAPTTGQGDRPGKAGINIEDVWEIQLSSQRAVEVERGREQH
jgi:hypothetical protein